MAPPVRQKYLVQVEKSKTRTIKFKNGFPPKIIRSRDFMESNTGSGSSEKLELAEYKIPLKKDYPSPLHHTISNNKTSKSQAQIANELVSSERRKGFIPSVTKHGHANKTYTKRSPFSPPPTMAELRSLTKKIGRFYTVNSETSQANPWTNRNQQKVILDIEKALSGKDVNGLERCYRRIFNGESAPIRTLVKNQFLPNQRSRQASYPLEIRDKSSPSSASSGISFAQNPNIVQKSSQRRWSVDSIQDKRLPYVPAPYIRNETRSSPAKSHGSRQTRERPVMFSSSNFDHKKYSRSSAPSTAILTLDPGQFLQSPTNRSQPFDSASGKSTASGTLNSSKKQIISKTSSIWNQRAPNSTPEPPNDNTESRRSLVPHVVTSQFHKSSLHASRSNDTKRAGIKVDIDSTNPQASNATVDRKEISEESESNVITSVRVTKIETSNNADESYPKESQKRASPSHEEVHNSPEELAAGLSSGVVVSKEEASSIETKVTGDLTKETASTSNEIADITEPHDVSLEEQAESHAVLKEERDIIEATQSNISGSKDPSSDEQMIETRIENDNKELNIKMDNVTVVVVNVTTDEGEDVNADIYEYENQNNKHQGEAQDSEKVTNEEGIVEIAKSAARSRKEELETLLKEHSHIVEEIKNLSDSEQS